MITKRIFFALLVVCGANFSCAGGCAGCGTTIKPLPAPVPKDQIIEGGVQVRVSQAGFAKLEASIPDLARGAFPNGICVPDQKFGTIGSFSSLEACDTNACPGNVQGCPAQFQIDSMNFQVPDGGPLTIDTTFEITSLPIHMTWFGGLSCTMNVTTSSPAHVIADIVFTTDPQSGELQVHLAQNGVRMANLPLNFSGCSILSPILNTLEPLINTALGQAIINALSGVIDGIIQSFLPHPLGLDGLLDTGALVKTLSPSTEANLEVHVVPGGYVDLHGGGLSLGIISGLNSDSDPSTRNAGASGPGTYHEHARCVPDLPLTLPNLPRQPTRGTFSLLPAPAFAGAPEVPTDFGIGVSRRFLDLAGFHVINSGTLCLDIGAAQLGLPLNVGTIGIIIPSLGSLADDPRSPMLIALRPQQTVTFDVGSGTMDDPSIQVTAREMKADLYAFIDDRYVRAFTLVIDLKVGVNLQFTMDAMGNPAVEPVLVGVNSQNLQINVENSQLLAESQDRLQMIFPMLTQILVPVLSGSLKPITLPQIGGFTLGNLRLTKLDDGQERFLAVYASLDKVGPRVLPLRVHTTARVTSAWTPPPALMAYGQTRPQVTLDLGADTTEPVEWQWRVDGGLWRPYQRDPHPVLSPAEFLLQGRHTIDVRSRPVGDYTREDLHPVRLEVVLDSLPPSLHPHVENGKLALGAIDLVTPGERLRYSPAGPTLTEAEAESLAQDGLLTVQVIDEAGNTATQKIDVQALFHGGSSGCSMSHSDDAAPLLLVALALLFLWRRRLALAALLAIGCGDDPTSCKIDQDCSSLPCSSGAIPLCADNMQCTCASEIPLGRVGRFSSLGLENGQAVISAYNETYGDLMIGHVTPPGVVKDWQFIDGVPAGPVVLPQSMVRGGIRAAGDDVGKFTSIAVGSDGHERISYHDATHGTLKWGIFDGTTWKFHVVDGDPTGAASAVVGWWTSQSLRSDGAPGIAYYADTAMPDGSHLTELRFAQAKNANPASSADWAITKVAEGTIPAPPGGMSPPSVDLPNGVGLFPSLARLSDGRPVIAYYDRQNGNLVLATASATGMFTTQILDGQDSTGDTGDFGLYPSVVVDGSTIHVTYEDGAHHNLRYLNTQDHMVEVIDDGYRIDGQNAEGLDQPVLHFVGDDSALVIQGGARMVVYQDATSHELLVASRRSDGTWMRDSIAGSNPDDGAFGFYANVAQSGSNAVISSYVINQRLRPPQFYVQVFTRPIVVP